MSDKDIVKMLRMIQGTSLPIRVWQHHMLRAASEIEQNRIDLEEYRRDVAKLTEERDRLKAALEPFSKLSTNREVGDPAEGTMRVRVVTVRQIDAAREALEAKE